MDKLNELIKDQVFLNQLNALPPLIKQIREFYPNLKNLELALPKEYPDHLVVTHLNHVETTHISHDSPQFWNERIKSDFVEMNLTGIEFKNIMEALGEIPYFSFGGPGRNPRRFFVTSEGWVENE